MSALDAPVCGMTRGWTGIIGFFDGDLAGEPSWAEWFASHRLFRRHADTPSGEAPAAEYPRATYAAVSTTETAR